MPTFQLYSNVGIAEIPHDAATSSNSSTSTFTNVTSGNFAASSSKYGPIALHGPHQVAVKSTNNLSGKIRSKCSKCCWKERDEFVSGESAKGSHSSYLVDRKSTRVRAHAQKSSQSRDIMRE